MNREAVVHRQTLKPVDLVDLLFRVTPVFKVGADAKPGDDLSSAASSSGSSVGVADGSASAPILRSAYTWRAIPAAASALARPE
jgi:hypothetical protein